MCMYIYIYKFIIIYICLIKTFIIGYYILERFLATPEELQPGIHSLVRYAHS